MIQKFHDALNASLNEGSFIKLSLGHYKGAEADLKNIYVRKIIIRGEEKLSFTYHHKTRDIVKNYSREESLVKITALMGKDFFHAVLHTTLHDFMLDMAKKPIFRKQKPSQQPPDSLDHNRVKNHIVRADAPYLHALNITDAKGSVHKNAQDKYKQINHYIEILGGLLKDLEPSQIRNVVDMGSGKGYLTFALYDYLHNVLKLKTTVTGVEYRPDMVKLCNDLAGQMHFNQLSFAQSTIKDYGAANIDILIALHACDTATDEAIYKGITSGAQLIVCAPCCHKQIRREMEKSATPNDLDFLTQHGIFMERQAEMVTDGLRSLIMEYFGYKTKIFEFISDAHTPKNVMLTGIKSASPPKKEKILTKIRSTKEYFGITKHHLEVLLDL